MTDRQRERSSNGGADRIPLPLERGGMWLCGRHFVGAHRALLEALAQV